MNKKHIRESIFKKYDGRCAYCGEELQKGWHIDYIEPVIRGLKTGKHENPENHSIENMNPSCIPCNIQKNSHTLEQFRRNIGYFVQSLNLYSTQYKFAKRYGLVNEDIKPVVFYFERTLTYYEL